MRTERAGTERVAGMRLSARNNYTLAAEQDISLMERQFDAARPCTQADVAMLLDRAENEEVERRGYSGRGAGCTALLRIGEAGGIAADDADYEPQEEEVCDLAHPLVRAMAPGSLWHLRRFIGRMRRASVWDGHNHARCSHGFASLLVDEIRAAQARRDAEARTEELADIRRTLNLSQAAFAGRLGIHANSVAPLLPGEIGLSEPVLRLARRLLAEHQAERAAAG